MLLLLLLLLTRGSSSVGLRRVFLRTYSGELWVELVEVGDDGEPGEGAKVLPQPLCTVIGRGRTLGIWNVWTEMFTYGINHLCLEVLVLYMCISTSFNVLTSTLSVTIKTKRVINQKTHT